MIKYNIGCGLDYRVGYVNIDKSDDVTCDLRWDLDEAPIPADTKADYIYLGDVLEHLTDKALDNVTESLRCGGVLEGTTPHYLSRNAYNEFSHRKYISLNTFHDSIAFRKHYIVKSIRVRYGLTKHLEWTMPNWFVRLQERIFPGIFPPTRIIFSLYKYK
jgi:predicted SAM-dependent methyltransferase